MAPPVLVPELWISGQALGAGADTQEVSTWQSAVASQHPGKAFQASALPERPRLQPTSGNSPVCSSPIAQRGSRGHPRRSWYKPGTVPEARPTGRDRSCCPWRWKNLCKANEQACSGSMCVSNKIRVCQRLAAEDYGNVGKIAQQATLGVTKECKLHETEKMMMLSGSSLHREPPQRMLPGCNLAPKRPMSAPAGARPPKASPQKVVPALVTSSSKPRAQSAGRLRSSTPVVELQSQQQSKPRAQSAGRLRSSAPAMPQPQSSGGTPLRPKSAGSAPAVAMGSAMRVGTSAEDLERSLRHQDLRYSMYSSSHGSTNKIHSWEEDLSLRTREGREDFDSRLQALERHVSLPTPSMSLMARYSLGEETGLYA